MEAYKPYSSSTIILTDQMATKQDPKSKNLLLSDHHSSSSNSDEEEEKEEIDLGICLDKLNLGPKKKLLVIPLGGFIVHRAHRRKPSDIPRNRRPDLAYGNFLIYKRPFCDEFMKFCFERFEVGLWSSSMEHNINGVLKIMGDMKRKLLFTWDQGQCTDSGFKCVENRDKPLFLKQLKHLWEKKKYLSLPWRDGEYSSSNTLLIGNPVNSLLNPPHTSISGKVYDPADKNDHFLGPDSPLRVFLDGLAEAKDVPTYVREHPFGEPPITPSHSHWDYYSKIIRHFDKK